MKIERDALQETIEKSMRDGYDYLVKITAVDYVDNIDVLYFVRDLENNRDQVFEVSLAPSDAWVPTVTKSYAAADWYERELSEMFGIDIRGRHTRRLLLEKWDGVEAPLRKSFTWGAPSYKSEG